MSGRDEIQWSPRLPKAKLRQLYRSDARGLLDDELLEDVGFTLWARCRDILKVEDAQRGRVHCACCDRAGTTTRIERPTVKGDPRDVSFTCPICGWQITWGEYLLSYRRKQLNPGGAVDAFRAYVENYPKADSPQAKMFAIDRLIHEFHFSYAALPGLPTRPAGVNLIYGKVGDVIEFLNELSFGTEPAVQSYWQENLNKFSEANPRIQEHVRKNKAKAKNDRYTAK